MTGTRKAAARCASPVSTPIARLARASRAATCEQSQRRRDNGSLGNRGGDPFGSLAFERIAGRQNRRQATLEQRLGKRAPVPFIPQLVVATGRRQQDDQPFADRARASIAGADIP
jgi:hypothetical protein